MSRVGPVLCIVMIMVGVDIWHLTSPRSSQGEVCDREAATLFGSGDILGVDNFGCGAVIEGDENGSTCPYQSSWVKTGDFPFSLDALGSDYDCQMGFIRCGKYTGTTTEGG